MYCVSGYMKARDGTMFHIHTNFEFTLEQNHPNDGLEINARLGSPTQIDFNEIKTSVANCEPNEKIVVVEKYHSLWLSAKQ